MGERNDLVKVRGKSGAGAGFAAGQKYSLHLAAGEESDIWADGSPITRAEFETLLAPSELFEIVEERSPT